MCDKQHEAAIVHEFGEHVHIAGFVEDPVHPIFQHHHLQIVGCGKPRLKQHNALFQWIVHQGVKVDDLLDASPNLTVGVLKAINSFRSNKRSLMVVDLPDIVPSRK